MNKHSSVINDIEFNCLLAISSNAFDINSFLDDFIKGAKMNNEHYKYLLDTACDLVEQVKTLCDISNKCQLCIEPSKNLNSGAPPNHINSVGQVFQEAE